MKARMTPLLKQRPGVTLIELIVTVAILGVVLGITTLSLAGEKRRRTPVPSPSAKILALRSAAVRSGVAQTAVLNDSNGAILITALPDGRVMADSPRLNGTIAAAENAGAR